MIRGKKGFQLTINTVVLLILASMLLLFIVLFFTGSAGPLLGKFGSYFSYTNVDNVIEGCNLLFDTNSEYAYCCEIKNVKYYGEGEKTDGEFSCSELKEKSFVNDKIKDLSCEGVSC
jgi:hypothetical protein